MVESTEQEWEKGGGGEIMVKPANIGTIHKKSVEK